MSTMNINGQIQLRHDVAQNWAVENPILLEGEIGLETDTNKAKIGDGTTRWNSLGYVFVPTVATGSTNGTISINGTDVAVKGLGSAAYQADTYFVKKSGDTLTGTLTAKANTYSSISTRTAEIPTGGGIDMNNADLTRVNSILWADKADGATEGILFPQGGNQYWDSLYSKDGALHIDKYDKVNGTTEYKYVPKTAVEWKQNYGNLVSNGSDALSQCMVNTLRSNKLMFLPADQVIIEKTTDGGVTWVDAGITDVNKQYLFSGLRSYAPTIPLLNGVRSTLCGLRITITGMKYNVPSGTAETQKYQYWNSSNVLSCERYVSLNSFYFWVSSVNDGISIKIETATGANPDTWTTRLDSSTILTKIALTGWSGGDFVNLNTSSLTFGGGTNQTGNTWNWRFTFFTVDNKGGTNLATTSNTSAQNIAEIAGYGLNVWSAPNSLVKLDHIYTWDKDQNVTFPAAITASKIAIPLGVSPSARPTTANKTYGDGCLRQYKASSSMTTGKPPTDANIIHLAWDNTGKYDGQIATSTSGDKLYWRTQNGSANWGSWKTAVSTTEVPASVGSATKPVYTNSSGVVTACTYSLNKDVPADAVFTDTTYDIATGSTNGTISVNGTDVSVKGLGSNAYDSTSYLPLSGGTLTGHLTLSGTATRYADKYTTIDRSTNPASNKSLDPFIVFDANNQRLMDITKYIGTNGDTYSEITDWKQSSSNVVHSLRVGYDATNAFYYASCPTPPNTSNTNHIATTEWVRNLGYLTSIPTASSSTLGGIKVGTNLSISNGVLSATDTKDWDSITGKPTFATVATSGSYNDLSNKPTIPTVPTNVSAFTNDAGYLTSVSWDDVGSKPTFATVATSGSYNDLSDKPTIPSAYTLPTASSNTLGGVKVGTNLSIDNNGVLSATDTTYTITQGSSNGTISVNGTDVSVKGLGTAAYTASTAYATASHEHSASDITSGTLGVTRGGTGKTSGIDACNYFLNELSTGSSTPQDNDYYISQYVGGGTTTKTYHRRPMSALYAYVKGKTDSVYLPLSGGAMSGGITTEMETVGAVNTYRVKYTSVSRDTAPSSNVSGYLVRVHDKDDKIFGGLQFYRFSSGMNEYRIYSYNANGDSVFVGVGKAASGTGGRLAPYPDNVVSLGFSSQRYTQLFAATTTISTSDERLKTNISAIPNEVLDAWGEVNWVQFQFTESVAEKGNNARYHTGAIAQRIKAVFESHNLDPFKYGLLCYDEWDADGEIEAGNRYSLRYEEALCLEAAYQRRRADQIESTLLARIEALERIVGGGQNDD